MPAITTNNLTQLAHHFSDVYGGEGEDGELAWRRINSNVEMLLPWFT